MLTLISYVSQAQLGKFKTLKKLQALLDNENFDFRTGEQLVERNNLKKLENDFAKKCGADEEYRQKDPLKYKSAPNYKTYDLCYCQYGEITTSHKDFLVKISEYENFKSQNKELKSEYIEKRIENRLVCVEDGNKYAVWASTESVEKEVVTYSNENKAAEPKKVIERAGGYLKALDLIENDVTLNLLEEAKSSLTSGKSVVSKIKLDAEKYISSGEYQKHLDKLNAEKITKVFMPKYSAKSAKIEGLAKEYVNDSSFKDFLKENRKNAVGSILRIVLKSTEAQIIKNNIDIPKSRYHTV